MGRPKIPQDILEAKEDIGDLARLQTMDKTSLVNAINEVRDSGGSGSGRGVFVSNVEQGSFVASGDTTTFTIPNMNGTKIEELIFENYQLVVGQSYSIVRSTGEVTLTFTLKQGETIYYRLFDTSYNYNELSGKPTIQDNLTTVDKGQILDARQGKILKDDINTRALKTEVGTLSGLTTTAKTSLVDAINESTNKINVLSEYKNMGSVSASNPNSNYKTGLFNVGTPIDGKYFYVTKIKYPDLGDGYYKLIAYGFDASDDKTKDSMWTGRIHAGQFTGWVNMSIGYVGAINTISQIQSDGCYEVNNCTDKTIPETYGTIFAQVSSNQKSLYLIGSYSNSSVRNAHYAQYNANTGQWNWKEIATTTKTDILLVPKLGFTIHENMSFKINNVVYINVTVYKTDGTTMVGINDLFEISEKPPTNRAFSYGCFSEKTWGAVEGSANVFCYNDGVVRSCVTSDRLVNGLIISGSYIVG